MSRFGLKLTFPSFEVRAFRLLSHRGVAMVRFRYSRVRCGTELSAVNTGYASKYRYHSFRFSAFRNFTVTFVGLGPGSAGRLSLETMAVLKSGGKVILRTAVHPTVKELERSGIKFTSCDAVYEQEASFEDVYQKIVASILQDAKEQEVYAVPGSPLVAERTVVLLRNRLQRPSAS